MTLRELETYNDTWRFYDVKDQLKQFVYKRSNEAFAKGNEARRALDSVEQLEERRKKIRLQWIESVGGLPSGDAPLRAKVTGVVLCEGFRIEKVVFESRPGIFVTANLYVPDGATQPRGAVLFLCGHHEQAKQQGDYQIVCQYFVRAGLVVLAQDPIGQGERLSYYEKKLAGTTIRPGTGEHDYAGSQCWPLGDGVARYFVHDAMRSVDYLCTRPEVDPARIGVTGSSGGGTQTSMMMICDPRIAAAAPATFIMNRQTNMYTGMAQDSEQMWPGMTASGFDHEDILLAMVPRPVLVLAVTSDFFPVEGARSSVANVKKYWEWWGKEENIELFEDESGHKYTRRMAAKAVRFFSLHLLGGTPVSVSDDLIRPLEPSLLWCTVGGQVRGEIEGARSVWDETKERLTEIATLRNRIPEAERKKQAIDWLRGRVFAHRKPVELNPRFLQTYQVNELTVQHGIWWAEEGLLNSAFLFTDYRHAGEEAKWPVTVAVWDGGTSELQSRLKWIRETCGAGRAVMVLDTAGVGSLLPHPLNGYDPRDFYGVLFKLTHDLMWLDDSLAAMRTYHVIRALDMAERWPGMRQSGVRIFAHGRQGVYGQFAAALDPRVESIEVVDGMGSYSGWVGERYYDHRDIMSVVVPGLLKYADLPDLHE